MGRHTTGQSVGAHGRWHAVLWGLLLLFVIIAACAGVLGYRFYTEANQVKAHGQRAIAAMEGLSVSDQQSLSTLSQRLPSIQHETRAARAIAHGSLWNVMSHMPYLGNDIVTVQGMTTAADDISTRAVPQFLQAVTQLKSSPLTSPGGDLNLKPLLNAQQHMTTANKALQSSVSQFNALPEPRIGRVKTTYDAAKTQLNAMASTAGSLTNALDVLPDFLGSGQSRTYAIMAMTTSEARSSGGLIGSVGVMTTDDGKIGIKDFKANTEYIPYGSGDPTTDEQRIFNAWGPLQMSFDIRDLAVFPDTSRTAQAMRAIWQRTSWGKGTTLDGVLLLDPVFLQALIGINGNVTLTNGQVLTGSNTAQFLLNTVYQRYTPAEQDVYFQEVAVQSIAKMFKNLNLEKLTAVGKLMGSMANGRHFSMYSFDTTIENRLSAAGFTAQSPHDQRHPSVGVYVTEQNPSKMDWYIHRTSTITRNSCNADGSQTYHVRYTMTNTLTASLGGSLPDYIIGVAGGLRTYGLEKTLIYAPAGGSITNMSATGNVYDSRRETMNGTAVNASLAKLAPGASVTYSFDVTTSTQSVTDLAMDQTPMGWEGNGVTENLSSCSIRTKK